jgi:hypothetical protein
MGMYDFKVPFHKASLHPVVITDCTNLRSMAHGVTLYATSLRKWLIVAVTNQDRIKKS